MKLRIICRRVALAAGIAITLSFIVIVRALRPAVWPNR
jgi:hypothetical protein